MGGAQSATDVHTEQHTQDQTLKNNGQICEISGKAEVNGQSEDEIAAEAILSADNDASEAEAPLQNTEVNQNESPEEEKSPEMIEMDVKQNDINESFRRFFSNINVKVTVKRGSAEDADATDVPDETTMQEPNRPEHDEDIEKEIKSETVEHNTDLNAPQETADHSVCPTVNDITSEDVLENADGKTKETKEEVSEEETIEQYSKSQEEVVVSPIKRFFTTGLFSGLRRKKKPGEDETTNKELLDKKNTEAMEEMEETLVQQQDKEISLGVEAVTGESEPKENVLKEEILPVASAQTADEGKSHSVDSSTITTKEPEVPTSQEKVQSSPLKRLLSASSFKKSSKKQRNRKLSDAKLSDSGEHVSNQLLSSTDTDHNQNEESPAEEDDGAWAAFKKLVTPKKRMKRESNEETQIPGPGQDLKMSEGEQKSDHNTEEGKNRKDSSVSWEAVLCGSGRRRSRSRKTSDSEEEKPQVDNNKNESPLESSNEAVVIMDSGGSSDCDGRSTWKSLKKLVTPKKKAKEEDESYENLQSDGESAQDEISFSIKKLLPGRKKRKPAEKQDLVSSDEAEKEGASADEDSETPAVVPLSEFDTDETGGHLQTHVDIESRELNKANCGLQQDNSTEPNLPCDFQQMEDGLENETPTAPAAHEEPDDPTELISKHQQLSDIPEEGIITDTMATPGSGGEDPIRDDTIAEDFIEITSEAITAPEPVDITLADESEMISAVSQLSESSKTSGNTTPVPAEYDIKDMEMLLHQAVENISTSSTAVPVCSDEVSTERIVASVSCQILETSVKQNPTVLQIHRRTDATAIHIGLNAEELDAINQLEATAQTESISEVNEALSMEIVSEVTSEEFDTAEISVDEIHKVHVIHLDESIKELEGSTESQDLLDCKSELAEAMSTDTPPETEEDMTNEGSLVEAEVKTSQRDKTKDGAVEHEVQTVLETKEEITESATDQVGAEQPPVEADIRTAETVTDEPKEEPELLTEVSLKSQKEDELKTDAEQCQVVEVLGAEQTAALDSDIQSPENEQTFSEDKPEEAVTDEKEHVAEVTDEHEDEQGQTEYEEVADIAAVRKAGSDLQTGSIKIPEEELQLLQNAPPAKAGPKEQTKHDTKVKVKSERKEAQADTEKLEHAPGLQAAVLKFEISNIKTSEEEEPAETEQELNEQTEPVPKDQVELENKGKLQADISDSEIGSIQKLEEEAPLTENTAGTVTDELKDESDPLKVHVDAAEMEHVQGPEVLNSEMGSIQTPEKKVSLVEDVPPAETGGPEEETKPVIRVHVELETKDELVSNVSGCIQAAASDSDICSIQTPGREVASSSQDTLLDKTVRDKPKHHTDVSAETENKEALVEAPIMEHHQEAVQVPRLAPGAEEDREYLSEVNVELLATSKTEHLQETKILEAVCVAESGSAENSGETLPAVTTQACEGRTEPEEELQVEDGKRKKDYITEKECEDVPNPDYYLVSSALESGVVSKLNEALETKRISQEAQVEPEVRIPEALNELQSLSAVHVSSVIQEKSFAQVLGKKNICEETPAPCVDDAMFLYEPEYVVHLGELQDSVEGEKEDELHGVEIKTLEVEHAVVAQVTTCNLKEVLTAVADVLMEKTSDIEEPLIDTVVSELEFNEEVERATPIIKEDLTKTAKEESLVVMMHVTSAKSEDDQRVQVQAVKTDLKSAEMPVDTFLDVGVTQDQEVIDVCHETFEEIDKLSATEEELINEENKVIIQEVLQHVKENLPNRAHVELSSQEEVINLEQEHSKDPDGLTEVSETKGSESNESETQGTFSERRDECPAINDESAAKKQTPKDRLQTPTIPETVDVSMQNQEGDLEEQKAELEKSEAAEEVKLPALEQAVVAQVTTSNVKEVLTAVADVLIEKTSDIKEPLIDRLVSELEVNEEVERATPIIKEDLTKTAKEESLVVMMHVTSAKSEYDHRVQVQVVKTDLKSAEMSVDSVLDVGVTQDQEVIDVCHETFEEIDKLSATEEELINEENKVIIQEVLQHVKENLQERADVELSSQEEVINLEQEHSKDPDGLTEVSETKGSESNEGENQILMEDISGTFSQRQDEIPAIINDSETQASEDLMQASTIPESVDVSLSDEEDVEEQKAELEKSEAAEEVKLPALEQAVVAQVTTCNLKEVSTAVADVLMEKTSDIKEPLIDTVVSELEVNEEVERATPIIKEDLTMTAKEESLVVMMHVTTAKSEYDHRVQVQVVKTDLKSAEMSVDSVLDAGVTQDQEVIDVCHETSEEIDKLSATEEELINEENKVIIPEVLQHVKENLQERADVELSSQEEVINLEQDHSKNQDGLIEVSETKGSESSEGETQGTFSQQRDESPAITDESAAQKQTPKYLLQTPTIPETVDASMQDQEGDLEEQKAELEKSEADATAEEVKLHCEDTINEGAQMPQISRTQSVTTRHTGLEVPQNTGMVSSKGLESPSSLSLKFKLNIQFGQTKAPACKPLTEVGVQAAEPPINTTFQTERQKNTLLTKAAVQATEITELEPATLPSTERAVIMSQPVLLDIGVEAMEAVQATEQIKPTERVMANIQAAETTQPVRKTEKREVFLSQPVLYDASCEGIRVEESGKQIEDDNEQDLWMDAQEDVYTQEEPKVSIFEVKELADQRDSVQEQNPTFEMAPETAPISKTNEEGGSQQEIHKTGETCEMENEYEEFTVALEHPETATMEWD